LSKTNSSSEIDIQMIDRPQYEEEISSFHQKQSIVRTPDLKHIAELLFPILNVVEISPVIDGLLRWQSQTSIFHNDNKYFDFFLQFFSSVFSILTFFFFFSYFRNQTLSNSFAEQVFLNKPLFQRLQQSTQISLFQQYSSLFMSELTEKIMGVVWRLALPDVDLISQFSILMDCFLHDSSLYIRTTEFLMTLFFNSHNIGLERIITLLNSQLIEKIRNTNHSNSTNSFLTPSVVHI